MVRSTPSTARTWPMVRLKTIPWVSGKYFFRPRTCSSSSPGVDAVRDAAVAPFAGSDTEDLLAVVAGRPPGPGGPGQGGGGGGGGGERKKMETHHTQNSYSPFFF